MRTKNKSAESVARLKKADKTVAKEKAFDGDEVDELAARDLKEAMRGFRARKTPKYLLDELVIYPILRAEEMSPEHKLSDRMIWQNISEEFDILNRLNERRLKRFEENRIHSIFQLLSEISSNTEVLAVARGGRVGFGKSAQILSEPRKQKLYDLSEALLEVAWRFEEFASSFKSRKRKLLRPKR